MATEYDADVIIVGSGAVGSNAAVELARQGKSVIMLEAGVRMERWKILDNFRRSQRKWDPNDAYPNLPWAVTSYEEGYIENTGSFDMLPGMLKLVGGTTWHWGGATWRYIPEDFKLRTLYGVGRDWPLEYKDLEPWYYRAEVELGVSGSNTQDQSGQGRDVQYPPRSKPYPVTPESKIYAFKVLEDKLTPIGQNLIHEPNVRTHVPYDGRPACQGNNNCLPICPIGAQYSGSVHAAKAERAGVKLITQAVVHKIELGDKRKIKAVAYLTPDGKSHRLTARYFIVAAHTFESAKLLLMNDVANSSDQVGRNLMDHVGIDLNFLAGKPLWMGRGPVQQGGIFTWRDGGFRAEHSAYRTQLTTANPQVGIAEKLIQQGYMGKELEDKVLDHSARFIRLQTYFEPLPDPSNRVQPSTTWKNALGLPGLKIHYNVDNYSKRGAAKARTEYPGFVEAMNGDKESVEVSDFVNHDHLMGALIMGSDPNDSVVNHECRAHDHDNLFVCSVGNIPAAGIVNPTLTSVALAIRAAAIIAREV